jgi:predicted glutamine amidotransferase
MCELLGMSANVPTDICFSFSGLLKRGGVTGPHKDGWGIAFYEGKACRSFKDPHASAASKIAQLIEGYPIKSKVVISHIRKATVGKVNLSNTQPYSRELWGTNWTFAHNGDLKNIKKKRLGFYLPIGTTDSEHAFCWIMDQIRKKYPKRPKSAAALQKYIHSLFGKLNTMGIANFLLSDSKFIFAYCSTKLCWITRKAPFGKAKLIDRDITVDFKKETGPGDIVTIIATQPLTKNETWNALASKEFITFANGRVV